MSAGMARPAPAEYAPALGVYIAQVPDCDLLQQLEDQRRETQGVLDGLSDEASLYRYAPGKWSIKEVAGHVMDAERVFAYRALRFARGDATPLAGFDEQAWMPPAHFDARPLTGIAAELDAGRQATLALFHSFDAETLERRGTANGKEVSVRALAYVIAGHERHHLAILQERYLS